MESGFRPFEHRTGPSRSVQEAPHDALVLDSWRHRMVDTSPQAGGAPGFHGPQRLGEQRRAPELSLSVGPALHPQKSVAELSGRRRDAIKAAFRRLDPRGQGWVTARDLAAALQQLSRLTPHEQEQVVRSLADSRGGGATPPGGSRQAIDWGGSISYTVFSSYYQLLGNGIERDRDFEGMMHHHYGFPGVSDILDDMKNNFAMVGLAYTLSNGVRSGGGPEMSIDAFQDALKQMGMQYDREDVARVFDAFGSGAGAVGNGGGTLEVHRLTDHLVSAARPETPLAVLYGSAHFSEVNSQAEFGDSSHLSPLMGRLSPSAALAPAALHGPGALPGGRLPATLPAPPEETEAKQRMKEYLSPPAAPPEGHDDGGPPAPPEPEADGRQPAVPVPEAPPEDDDGQVAPEEQQGEDAHSEPPKAPAERSLDVAAFGGSPRLHGAGPPVSIPGYHPAGAGQQAAIPSHHPASADQATAIPGYHPAMAAAPAVPTGPPHPAAASGQSSKKRAVTVGVNYLGLKCQLSGCINDSDTFIKLLEQEFGYEIADIRQLRDDTPRAMPTRKNMLVALQWLVAGAQPGDHLFFHYSGHGSQQADRDGDEKDGKDETLVPCDYQTSGMLSDDELRRVLVQPLPQGVRLTVILDCCHSGTALDLPYKVKLRDGDLVDIKKKLPHQLPRPVPADVVMISGCQDDQTSADIGAGAAGNTQPAGAMTTAFGTVISRRKDASHHRLIAEMRRFLRSQGFKQVPQLSSEHFLDLTACFMPERQPPEPAPAKPLRPPVRKALTVGINYLCLAPGHGQLSGCINDSDTMIGVLRRTFRFQEGQICRLRDDDPNAMPTKANMLASFRWLTEGAAAGDELFLHYSGHGGRQRDTSGDEVSGKDDTLIPCDFQTAGQIVDDDLHRLLVADLPAGCRLWVILDCCHSGTALDLRFKVQLSQDGRSVQCNKSPSQKRPGAGLQGPTKADVIMLSGCKDTQTSADVQAGSMGVAKAAGAMTTAFHHSISPSISCEDLLLAMRHFLKRNGYEQVPQMSSEQFLRLDASFVSYSRKAQAATAASAAPAPAPAPVSGLPPPPSHLGSSHGASPGQPADLHTRLNALQDEIAQLRVHRQPQYAGGDALAAPHAGHHSGHLSPGSPHAMGNLSHLGQHSWHSAGQPAAQWHSPGYASHYGLHA